MLTVLDKRVMIVPGVEDNPPAYYSQIKMNENDEIKYLTICTHGKTTYTISDTSLIDYVEKKIDIEFGNIKFLEIYEAFEETKVSKYAGLYDLAYKAILYYSNKKAL